MIYTVKAEFRVPIRCPGRRAYDPGMDAPDYTDRFTTAKPPASRTAEAWMRAVLEDAPAALRGFVRFGWRLALGFPLGPSRAPEYVLGWPVARAEADEVVLRQGSRLLTADLTLRVTGTGLEWTTRVRYRHRAARAVWAVVRLVHVRVVPYVLRRAAASAGEPVGDGGGQP